MSVHSGNTFDQHSFFLALDTIKDIKKPFKNTKQNEAIDPRYQAIIEKQFSILEKALQGNKEYSLWKKNIAQSTEEPSITTIAKILCENKDGLTHQYLKELKNSLLEGNLEKIFNKEFFEQFPLLEKLAKDLSLKHNDIYKLFSHSIRALHRAQGIIEQLKTNLVSLDEHSVEAINIKKLEKDILAWSLNYLVRGARISLDTSNQTDFPLLDFYDDHENEPIYYRGDSSPFVDLYNELFKDHYQGLNKFSLEVIRNGIFSDVLQHCCDYFVTNENEIYFAERANRDNVCTLYSPTEERDLKRIIEEMHNDPKKIHVLDVSNLLIGVQPQDLETKLTEYLQAIKKEDKFLDNIVITAQCKIDGQEFFTFLPTSDNLPTLRGLPTHHRVSDDMRSYFKNFLGGNGLCPEMSTMRRSFLNLTGSREFLSTLCPSEPKESVTQSKIIAPHLLTIQCSEENVSTKAVSVFKKLDGATQMMPSTSLKNYTEVLAKLLNVYLDSEGLNFRYKDNNITNMATIQALENIEHALSKMMQLAQNKEISLSQQHMKIIKEFNRIVEELTFLSVTLKPQKNMPADICDIANNAIMSTIRSLNKSNSFSGINCNSFTFTSGMSCFGSIASAIQALYNSPEKIKAIFMEGSYFELNILAGSLKDFIVRSFNVDTKNQEEIGQITEQENRVLFTDLHPNFAPLEKVETIKVVEAVQNLLKAAKEGKPCVLVLDTSTTAFFHPEIIDIIENLSGPIKEGKLVVFTVNSLAKYCGMGIDKHTGGIVNVYTKDTMDPNCTQEMTKKSDQDPFSVESQMYFRLLLGTSQNNIIQYVDDTKETTQYVYEQLMGKLGPEVSNPDKTTSPITVAQKDKGIPVIGLHCTSFVTNLKKLSEDKNTSKIEEHKTNESDIEEEVDTQNTLDIDELKENFTFFLQYFLYGKSLANDCPLMFRSSFSFPTSTSIECGEALRLAMGIEDSAILDKYVETIIEVNNQLKVILENKTLAEKFMQFFINNNEGFKEFIFNNQFALIQLAKDGNIENFIEKILELKTSEEKEID